MKILHVGNIANNAYNNAKFLRRKGIEADVLCHDYTHVMAQPEWEDAHFEGQPDEYRPQWEALDLNGFQRPPWFLQENSFGWTTGKRKKWFKGQFFLEEFFKKPTLLLKAWPKYMQCWATKSKPCPHFMDVVVHLPNKKQFERWYEGYDLIQAYATEPIPAWLFGSGRPYVAFEHGTMREIPFEDSGRGRLLTLAYRQAGKVIITNPDVIASACRLGLKNFVFIPHPVDETKYRPGPTTIRDALVSRYQADLLLFAPSRHNWALKGNDLLIRAFSRFLKATSTNPLLILSDWGQEVAASRQLIGELGIGHRVMWTPPLNKMTLIEYYNAADLVLDQFIIGTFGTVTPEAMACEKPVILHFDRQVHEWCYGEMPPVISARTVEQIFERLVELGADLARRETIGRASREWIVKYHGWELVADRQIAVYRELLGK